MKTVPRRFNLSDGKGERYESEHPGTLGGYRKGGIRIYGRLNCPSALRAIANGNYMRHRVFFADEITALSAGFRPCAKCLPKLYAEWKLSPSEWQKKETTCHRLCRLYSRTRELARLQINAGKSFTRQKQNLSNRHKADIPLCARSSSRQTSRKRTFRSAPWSDTAGRFADSRNRTSIVAAQMLRAVLL
jgi:Metal binding domain of Ada